jgi:Iap family predicted aminopeptidase
MLSQVIVGMLMHKPPTRGRAHSLIEQLGLKLTPNGDIELTNTTMLSTNVPGCIVAGDTQDMMKQAILAAGSGKQAVIFSSPNPRISVSGGIMVMNTALTLQTY